DLAGQHARRERAPGDEAHPLLARQGEVLALDRAHEEVVLRLERDEARPAVLPDVGTGGCQHKVEMSAFAPSRDVRGCVDQGSTEDAEDDAAARSRFLARSVTFGLARRAASRSCCCAAIQAKTPSRCLCSTTTPGTSRA